MRILVVEDDLRLADALEQIITKEKYQVDIVHDGNNGYSYAVSGIYDVIIMDVMMPGVDGLQLTSQLRKDKICTPILMLTAKSTVDDKVAGLDHGADDYMTKPFEPKELLARIRALTRRQGEVVVENLEFGSLKLDLQTCELSAGEKSTKLSFKEFEIMKILMSVKHVIVSKDTLLVKVWGYDSEATENNVEAYISFLRKKLNFIGAAEEIISIRKLGYQLKNVKET